MESVGLAEMIGALHRELNQAIAEGQRHEIRFPIGSLQLEFHVGITKEAEGSAGVRFWVVEMGATGKIASESIQRVTVTLEAPVDSRGERVLVGRGSDEKP